MPARTKETGLQAQGSLPKGTKVSVQQELAIVVLITTEMAEEQACKQKAPWAAMSRRVLLRSNEGGGQGEKNGDDASPTAMNIITDHHVCKSFVIASQACDVTAELPKPMPRTVTMAPPSCLKHAGLNRRNMHVLCEISRFGLRESRRASGWGLTIAPTFPVTSAQLHPDTYPLILNRRTRKSKALKPQALKPEQSLNLQNLKP